MAGGEGLGKREGSEGLQDCMGECVWMQERGRDRARCNALLKCVL